MAVVYRVDLENNTGVLIAQFKDFRSLTLTLNWNGLSSHQLNISGWDSRISLFQNDSVIRVWMKDDEEQIPWTNIYSGLHKTYDRLFTQKANRSFTSWGYSFEGLLDGAYIMYKAGENSKAQKSGNATTVLYEYVRENIGADATLANGRVQANVVADLIMGADLAVGGSWAGSRAFKNLLKVAQEITAFSREVGDPIDFRVRYLGGGQAIFETGYLYTDRTTNGLVPTTGKNGAGNVPVVFSPIFGNTSTYRESKSRYNESNVVYVLGQGEGDDRAIVVVEDTISKTASKWARRETTINATDDAQQSELPAVGQAVLQDRIADENITFQPRKGAQIFLRDYFLGDYVTGESFFTGQRSNKQIVQAKISVAPTTSGTVDNVDLDFADI